MYALTKLLGEDLCRGYLRSYGLPVTIFRFAMTLGGAEILNWPQFYASHYAKAYANKTSPAAKAVYAQLQAALADNPKTLVVARDENGRAYKKHIAYADDIVAGFPAALGKPQWAGHSNWPRRNLSPGMWLCPIWPKSWGCLSLMCGWSKPRPPSTNSIFPPARLLATHPNTTSNG